MSSLAPWSSFALQSQIAPCPNFSVMGITAMSLAQGREQEHPCSGETGQAGEKGKGWFSLGGTGIEDRGQPVVSALELGLLPWRWERGRQS